MTFSALLIDDSPDDRMLVARALRRQFPDARIREAGGPEALAQALDELQAKDSASDGSRAHAFGQYLSASLRIILPIPRACGQQQQRPLSLSCMRNLRAAAASMGVAKLAACPLKAAGISARAKVPSEAHFYMCDRGSGPVHAHRAKLA
jgi:CheY-like chemotaxis protein